MPKTYRQAITLICSTLLLSMTAFSAETHLYPLRTTPNGHQVYVDTSGEIVIATGQILAEEFSQGYAAVSDGNSWYFIDQNGKKVFGQVFEEAGAFSEGLAAVKIDNCWGYIDTAGKMAIKPEYTRAYRFSDGVACVMTGNPENGSALYGYINKDGRFAIEPFLKCLDNQFFTAPGEFSEGLAAAWLPLNNDGDSAAGYINKAGKIAITPKFNEAGRFVDGLAPVSILSDNEAAPAGYIATSGNFIIAPQFGRASEFSEGLAAAATFDANFEKPEKWGYIDRNGKWAIAPEYEWAENFVGGIARVHGNFSDGNEIYIKKDGSVLTSSEIVSGKKAGVTGIYKLDVSAINASSFLAPARGGITNYKPENLLDANPSTAWIESAVGKGIGEWVEFSFDNPVELHSIEIWNGYQKAPGKNRDPFMNNLCPAIIRIDAGGIFFTHELEQKRGSQDISLPAIITDKVKIEILTIHENPEADPDSGFSDIEFSGRIASSER